MHNTSRCREKIEGSVGRRRTYKCRGCGQKFQEDRLSPLPVKERYCPECWLEIKRQNNAGEITIQRLLEDFEQAEAIGKLYDGLLNKEITWKSRQFQVLVRRKSPGYDNFEIHVTKRRII